MSCALAGERTDLEYEPTTQIDTADFLGAVGEPRADRVVGGRATSKDSEGEQGEGRDTSEREHHGGGWNPRGTTDAD